MKKKYRYAHIFTVDSSIYNKAFQKLIAENFNVNEHVFIYLRKNSYLLVNNLSYGDTIYDESLSSNESLYKALEIADIVFIHNNSFKDEDIAKLSDEDAKRLVWCIWGSDLYRNDRIKAINSIFYAFLLNMYHILRYRQNYNVKKIKKTVNLAESKINNFLAICAGFEGDIIEIKNRFPNVNVFKALYPGNYFLGDIINWEKNINSNCCKDQKLRILLGHSAFPHLQHKKWLKKLKRFKDKIQLYIPLNYGDKQYANNIEIVAKKIYGDSAICFKDALSSKEYFTQIISQVDIAIFDFNMQSAYGNALLLLYSGKQIYYPKNSVMYKGLSSNGVKVFSLNELDINKLIIQSQNKDDFRSNINFAKQKLDLKTYIEQWDIVFSNL